MEMYHYVNAFDHPHKVDSTIKSILADIVTSGTYIMIYYPHEKIHKRGHTIFVSSACGNKLPSNTACTLALYQLIAK